MGVANSGKIKSIQRGVVTIAGTTNNATATISAVNTAKATVDFLGSMSGSTSINDCSLRVALTNATTVTANRAWTSTAADVTFQVIEYY